MGNAGIGVSTANPRSTLMEWGQRGVRRWALGDSGVIPAGEEQRGHLRSKLPPREAVGEAHRAVRPGDWGDSCTGATVVESAVCGARFGFLSFE